MARILPLQLSVGITQEIGDAITEATRYSATPDSIYVREAIVMRLMNEGYLPRPQKNNYQNGKSAINADENKIAG